MNASTNVGARQRQRLAQVEGVAKFVERRVTCLDGDRSRRVLQPAGKRLLSGASPRQREQLEQRSATEQIEVGGIEMLVLEEPFARVPGSGPAIFETRQAAVVERDQASRRGARPDHAIMPPQQH